MSLEYVQLRYRPKDRELAVDLEDYKFTINKIIDSINDSAGTDVYVKVGRTGEGDFLSPSYFSHTSAHIIITNYYTTTAPLEGGGNLSATRTLAITGLSTLGTANYLPGVNSAGTGWEYKQLAAGTGISVTHAANLITIAVTTSPAHDVLSATHTDTAVGSVVKGDLITGQSTPAKWTRLALGTTGYFLKATATDVVWAAHGLTYSDVGAAAYGHNHDSDYISIIASPQANYFPYQTAGGELVDSGYSGASFLTSVTAHNLLSATHGDTLAHACIYNGFVIGNSTPAWDVFHPPAGFPGGIEALWICFKESGLTPVWEEVSQGLTKDLKTTDTPQFAGLKIGAASTGSPVTIQSLEATGMALRIIGRSDHYGFMEFYKSDNSTLEGSIYGITGQLVITGPDTTAGLTVTNTGTTIGHDATIGGAARIQGWVDAGAAGQALEIGIYAGVGYIYNYNRTTSAEGIIKIGGAADADLAGVYIDTNGVVAVGNTHVRTTHTHTKASVSMSANQSNISASWTRVGLDTEAYDIGSNFNISTYLFTAPVTGYYQVNAMVLWESCTATHLYYAAIYAGGAYALENIIGAGGTNTTNVLSGVIYLAATNTVELLALSASNDGADVTGGNVYATNMSIHLLSV